MSFDYCEHQFECRHCGATHADIPKVSPLEDKICAEFGHTVLGGVCWKCGGKFPTKESGDNDQVMVTEKFVKKPDGSVEHSISDILPIARPLDEHGLPKSISVEEAFEVTIRLFKDCQVERDVQKQMADSYRTQLNELHAKHDMLKSRALQFESTIADTMKVRDAYREALEKIADPSKRHYEPDMYTRYHCLMHIADEALAQYEGGRK